MKRRGKGSKEKGARFERLACAALSLWITDGERDDVFWRSSMSGGRATVRLRSKKKSPHVAGDICATHPRGEPFIRRFFVECKNEKDLGLTSAVLSSGGKLADYWDVATRQAHQHGKLPIIIFKQNLYAPMIGLDASGVAIFNVRSIITVHLRVLGLHLLPLAEFVSSADRVNVSQPIARERPRLKEKRYGRK